jgi:hypothetical protein
VVVFPGNDAPLWEPVSRERYLTVLIRQTREKLQEDLRDLEEAEESRPDAAERQAERQRLEEELKRSQEEMLQVARMMEMMGMADSGSVEALEQNLAESRKYLEESRPDAGMERQRDREADSLLAEARRNYRERAAQRIAALEAELDALSPAERTSQAWVRISGRSSESFLTPPNAPGARPLMAVNHDYIDPTLPPEQIQIVVVILRNRADHLPESHVITQVRRQLEWNRIWEIIRRSRTGGRTLSGPNAR